MDAKLAALWQEMTERTDYERCERPRAARLDQAPAARLLEALGRPQDAVPAFHVAGSKGKGSTGAFLAAGLQAGGHRVGVYSSPHLSDWRERATCAGEFLPDEVWASSIQAVLHASQGDETFFDLLTAAAFLGFAEAGCTRNVIEVGLGGRFDSTNVLRPLASLVTSIEREHEDVLGPGLARIAWNKAGIYQPEVPAFAAAGIPAEARAMLEEEAARVGQEVRWAPASWPGGEELALAHQRRNHALAAFVLEQVGEGAAFDPREVRLPGRWETRWHGWQEVVFDVAHSENSLAAVLESFRRRYHERSTGVVFALRDDKDPAALADALRALLGPRPAHENWWVCPAGDHPRSADPQTLAGPFAATVLPQPTLPPDADVLLVTGSTYLVGALRDQTQAGPPAPDASTQA